MYNDNDDLISNKSYCLKSDKGGNMEKPNADIKSAARAAGVPMWKIADKLEIHEQTLNRKLRHEFSAEEKEQIYKIIAELK